MISDYDEYEDNNETEYGLSKTQIKRECHHLVDVGDEIMNLSAEDRASLHMPAELEDAINVALKIKSRSGLKRQRQYIGKLLRNMESEDIEQQLRMIQHRHDTNTATFHRLEKWRDQLIENKQGVFNEVIQRYPEIDRQHLNQLLRSARQELDKNRPPASSRKLFRYLKDLEEQAN